MSLETNIAWCHSTLPYWEGCTPISEECANCWAWARDKRHLLGKEDHFGKGKPRRLVKGFSDMLRKMNSNPIVKGECRRIFANHTADFLDPEVDSKWLAGFLGELLENPACIRILCTKRPELFFYRLYDAYKVSRNPKIHSWINGHCPPGVCLLVSVGNSRHVDRIPYLRAIPAFWRGVSIEPLLGPITCSLRGLSWVIIGGESGPKARVCCHHWITELITYARRDECAIFVKQTGSNYEREFKRISQQHSAGGDPSEWVEEIRIREYPPGFRLYLAGKNPSPRTIWATSQGHSAAAPGRHELSFS